MKNKETGSLEKGQTHQKTRKESMQISEWDSIGYITMKEQLLDKQETAAQDSTKRGKKVCHLGKKKFSRGKNFSTFSHGKISTGLQAPELAAWKHGCTCNRR